MQKISLYILAIVAVFVTNSCKKGNVISDPSSLGIGSYITLVKSNNTIIDNSNLATSKVSITVKEFGSPVDKIKVFVTKGTTSLDKSKWKLVKEFTYSGETTLEVSATDIAKALGIPPTGLETGATYTLYNQVITKDGRSFDIVNTYSEFASNTNYNMVFTWTAVVVCPYVSTGFAGDFEVLEDGWGDFNTGDIVKVSLGADPAKQIKITAYPNPAAGGANRKDIVIDIAPASGIATVASQVYGDYPGFDTNLKVKTVGTNNYVFSCVRTITLRLNHSGRINYGDANLRLKKI
ncbi:MAG: hypothetical protein WKF91_06515 [Segetibacter sp.]